MKRIELNLSKLALNLTVLDFSLQQTKLKDLAHDLNINFVKSNKWHDVINKAKSIVDHRTKQKEYDEHTNKLSEILELEDPIQLEHRESKSKKMQEKALALHREFALAIVELIKENAKQHYRFRFKEITEHSEIETDLKGHIIKAQTVFSYPLLIIEG